MFTQTHLLVSAALFARPGAKAVAIAGLAGALVPDSDVWMMFIAERASGSTGCEVFHFRYWQEPWTTVQSILNSIPLYIAMTGLGAAGMFMNCENVRSAAKLVFVFALSSLIHVSTDFLLHHEDARAQLLPFSSLIFRSPVSYWDPSHFGKIFGFFEIGLAAALIAIVGRRYARRKIWILLFVATAGYSGSIAASFMELSAHDRGPESCQPRIEPSGKVWR